MVKVVGYVGAGSANDFLCLFFRGLFRCGPRQAYYQSLRRVRLSGPTLFQAIINQAAQIANSTRHTNSVSEADHVHVAERLFQMVLVLSV